MHHPLYSPLPSFRPIFEVTPGLTVVTPEPESDASDESVWLAALAQELLVRQSKKDHPQE